MSIKTSSGHRDDIDDESILHTTRHQVHVSSRGNSLSDEKSVALMKQRYVNMGVRPVDLTVTVSEPRSPKQLHDRLED